MKMGFDPILQGNWDKRLARGTWKCLQNDIQNYKRIRGIKGRKISGLTLKLDGSAKIYDSWRASLVFVSYEYFTSTKSLDFTMADIDQQFQAFCSYTQLEQFEIEFN